MVDLKRNVTHNKYINVKKNKKYYDGLPKEINTAPRKIKREWITSKNSDFLTFNQKYIHMKTGANAIPYVGGGVCLLALSLFTFGEVEWNAIETSVFLFIILLLTFFIILRCRKKSIS